MPIEAEAAHDHVREVNDEVAKSWTVRLIATSKPSMKTLRPAASTLRCRLAKMSDNTSRQDPKRALWRWRWPRATRHLMSLSLNL